MNTTLHMQEFAGLRVALRDYGVTNKLYPRPASFTEKYRNKSVADTRVSYEGFFELGQLRSGTVWAPLPENHMFDACIQYTGGIACS